MPHSRTPLKQQSGNGVCTCGTLEASAGIGPARCSSRNAMLSATACAAKRRRCATSGGSCSLLATVLLPRPAPALPSAPVAASAVLLGALPARLLPRDVEGPVLPALPDRSASGCGVLFPERSWTRTTPKTMPRTSAAMAAHARSSTHGRLRRHRGFAAHHGKGNLHATFMALYVHGAAGIAPMNGSWQWHAVCKWMTR